MSWETFFHLKYFGRIQDKLALIIFRCMVKISWDHLAVGFLLSPFFFFACIKFVLLALSYAVHSEDCHTQLLLLASYSYYLLPQKSFSHIYGFVFCFVTYCLTKHVCITWGLLVFDSARGVSQTVGNKRQCPVVLEHFPLFSVSWAIVHFCFCCISLQTEASLIRTESSVCVWA